ncbi:hypothetical protein BHE74_00000692 [Ensete ventricosum]|nr:hypothetical protein BHE74_00000692 [Ensete ventricosum]
MREARKCVVLYPFNTQTATAYSDVALFVFCFVPYARLEIARSTFKILLLSTVKCAKLFTTLHQLLSSLERRHGKSGAIEFDKPLPLTVIVHTVVVVVSHLYHTG